MSDIHVTLNGNVAGEPQQHLVQGNATLTTFRLACTERRFDRAANRWVDGHTSFLTVLAWRTLGEHAFASVHKGDPVTITGRLRVREWSKDERKGVAVEVEAATIGHDLSRGISMFSRPMITAPADPWEVPVAEPAAA